MAVTRNYCIGLLCGAKVTDHPPKCFQIDLLFGFVYPDGNTGTKIYNIRWSKSKQNYTTSAYYTRAMLSNCIPELKAATPNINGDVLIIDQWAKKNTDTVFQVNYSNKKNSDGQLEYPGGLHIMKSKKKMQRTPLMRWPSDMFRGYLSDLGFEQDLIDSCYIDRSGRGNYQEFVKQIKRWSQDDQHGIVCLMNANDYVYMSPADDKFLATSLSFKEFNMLYPLVSDKHKEERTKIQATENLDSMDAVKLLDEKFNEKKKRSSNDSISM